MAKTVRITTWYELGRPVPRTSHHGAATTCPADPGQKRDRPGQRADVIRVRSSVVPGLRPVSIKGIQAALTRRSDPPLTELAPLSPRGRGAGVPHTPQEIEKGS